jgi:hypothetical protein
MVRVLAGAVAAAIVLAPIGGAQEGMTLENRVAALEEAVVVLEVDARIEAKVRRRDDRRLARCVAKPTIEKQNACADRFLEWTR